MRCSTAVTSREAVLDLSNGYESIAAEWLAGRGNSSTPSLRNTNTKAKTTPSKPAKPGNTFNPFATANQTPPLTPTSPSPAPPPARPRRRHHIPRHPCHVSHASSANATASFACAGTPNSSISRTRTPSASNPSRNIPISVAFLAPPPATTNSTSRQRSTPLPDAPTQTADKHPQSTPPSTP